MIEAEKAFAIEAPIELVWDYVRDISRWANLLPGCRECAIIDDHHSRWTVKVGAGGLVKTVNVLVHVEKWDGPERVSFTYKLESEPVIGGGYYIATRKSANETDISLKLRVEGSGSMAPMWEAMCKPLFQPLATAFTGKLKAEIEQFAGVQVSKPAPRSGLQSVLAALLGGLRKFWLALTGSKAAADDR
ncbi:MAG TPA: SRPBCC family protein [Dongiaceae bacterium]|nr:SRPBCC family protein [Dongiaceae bacterium]